MKSRTTKNTLRLFTSLILACAVFLSAGPVTIVMTYMQDSNIIDSLYWSKLASGVIDNFGAKTADAATTGSLMVYHNNSVVSTPKYRLWDGSAWGSEQAANNITGEIAYTVLKYAPTRDEAILVTQSTTGKIQAQIFNGSSWGSVTDIGTITGNGLGADQTTLNGRAFDFEYEQTSGDAVIVYADETADPDYKVWNGTTWSSATNIDIPTTGIIRAIEVAGNPANDQLAFIINDANSDIYGMRWDGSAWSNMAVATVWETTSSLATKKPIDVAFERNSGDIMFAWGFATVATAHFRYRAYASGALGSVTNVTNANNGGVVHWLKLAPDPVAASNKIMIGLLDAGSDLNTYEWSGTAWSAVHTEHSAGTEDLADKNFDLLYETHATNSGDVWLTYGNSATVTRKKWDAGAWGTSTTTGDDTATTVIVAQPNSGAVFNVAYEDNTAATDDILTHQLTSGGTTWSSNTTVWSGPAARNLGFSRVDIAGQKYSSSIEAMMVYDTQTIVSTPKYRVWNGTSWGVEQSAQGVNGDIAHMTMKYAPTRNEALLVTYGSTGDIQAQIWNGSGWNAPTLLQNYTGNGIGPDLQALNGRPFDIDYENTSGDAVVVYADNSADPDYKVWNGTSWSGATNIDIQTTGQIAWIETDYKRGSSDDMAAITLDANSDVYGMHWSGTAWDDMNAGGTEAVWDATAASATRKAVDVAYENTSGDIMFAWGDGTATTHLNYRTYVGTTFSAVTTLANANQGGLGIQVKLASDPAGSSNKIMLAEVDAGSDLNTYEWSGTAWSAVHTEHSAGVEEAVDMSFDIIYETHSSNPGVAWLVYGDGATVSRKRYTGTWATATTTGDDTAQIFLTTQPDSGAVFALAYEDNTAATDDILTFQLTSGGTTWSGNASIWGGPVSRNVPSTRIVMASERFTVPSGITISGNIYTDEGTTAYNCSTNNLTVSIKVNGVGAYTGTCTAGSGAYSISTVTVAAGNVISIFLDGETEKAVTVTRALDASTNITTAHLYQNRAIVRHEDAGPITNINLDQYDSGNDADVPFSVAAGNLTVADGSKLLVWTGDTFTPGGAVTTDSSNNSASMDGDVTIQPSATLAMAANTLSIGGDFINSGAFAYSSGQTTIFTATATGHSIEEGTNNFHTLTFSGSGGGWSFVSEIILAGDLSVNAGVLSGTQNITVNGGDVTGDGAINLSNGVFTLDAGGNFGGGSAWIFNNLTFGDGTGSTISTSVGSGSINVAGNLVIAANQTLDGGSKVWTLSGNFINNGNFTSNTSSVNLTPSGLVAVLGGNNNITFNNLTIDNQTRKDIHFTDSRTYSVGGNFTVLGRPGEPTRLVSATPGNQWIMNFTGTSQVNFVLVQDAACGGNSILLGPQVFGGGNNGSCWQFVQQNPQEPPAEGGGSGSGGGMGGGVVGNPLPPMEGGSGSGGGMGGGVAGGGGGAP